MEKFRRFGNFKLAKKQQHHGAIVDVKRDFVFQHRFNALDARQIVRTCAEAVAQSLRLRQSPAKTAHHAMRLELRIFDLLARHAEHVVAYRPPAGTSRARDEAVYGSHEFLGSAQHCVHGGRFVVRRTVCGARRDGERESNEIIVGSTAFVSPSDFMKDLSKLAEQKGA